MISQSLRDCSEDAGEVSSMYSTPKASKAFAILTLVSVSKNALANCRRMINIPFQTQFFFGSLVTCSPSRKVLSMILKFETLER